jgi:DNA-binding transcriptional LysR family regulator
MNSEQLTYFIEAAESLNFTDVAKRNYMTQPAISRQISNLEEDLGIKLFLRLGHRVQLTAEGAFFLKEAKKIIGVMQEAATKTKLLGEGKTGQITIGAVSTSNYILSHCMSAFSRQYPGIMINVGIETAAELTARLQSGEYDFVFTDAHMLPEDENISHTVTGHDQFCLVLPERHPLQALPCEENGSLPFWPTSPSSSSTGRRARAAQHGAEHLRRRGYAPKIVNQYNRAEAVLISVGQASAFPSFPASWRNSTGSTA